MLPVNHLLHEIYTASKILTILRDLTYRCHTCIQSLEKMLLFVTYIVTVN